MTHASRKRFLLRAGFNLRTGLRVVVLILAALILVIGLWGALR